MAGEVRIPVEDIIRQYPRIKAEVEAAIAEVLPTGKYVLGPNVSAFEAESCVADQQSDIQVFAGLM